MVRLLLWVLLGLFTCSWSPLVRAQPPSDTLWSWSTSDSGTSQLWGVEQSQDGGCLAVGCLNCFAANQRGIVVKLHASGDTVWSRLIPGGYLWSVRRVTDDDYVAAGSIYSPATKSENALLVKITSNGEILWTRTYDLGYPTRAKDALDAGDGYAVVGQTLAHGADTIRDGLLIRTALDGSLRWFRTYGGGREDWFRRGLTTQDRGFLLFGSSASFGSGVTDYYVVRTDSVGHIVWERTYGTSSREIIGGACQSEDGYLIAGSVPSAEATANQVYVVKIGESGDSSWTRVFGASPSAGLQGFDVVRNPDGSYVVVGALYPSGHASRLCFLGISAVGDSLWLRSWGSRTSGMSLRRCEDGGYIAAGHILHWRGYNDFDPYVVRTRPNR